VTKQEFVDRVVGRTNLSPEAASAAVDAFLESMTDALQRGEEIEIEGMGTLTTRRRNRTMGRRNPGVRHIEVDDFFFDAADELREEAEELKRGHEDFLESIGRSQQTLKEIAKS
jgi:nucleoid DNA-binding protein